MILDCLRLAGPTSCVELATTTPRPLDVDLFLPCCTCFVIDGAGTCFALYLKDLFYCILMGDTAL